MTKDKLKEIFKYAKAFIKWSFFAFLIGIFGGCVGSFFHLCIDYATELRHNLPWLIFLLPLGGIVISAMYFFAGRYGKLDTNRIIKAVQSKESVPFILVPLIFVSTVITHLLGGSAGREGAALQLGGGIGYRLGHFFKLGVHDTRIIIMTGMSAVFTALFGTPLTATVFAIEVSSVGIMHYGALFPCVISSLVAFGVQKMFGVSPVKFADIPMPDFTPALMASVVLVSVLCGLVSIVFCKSIKISEKLGKKFLPNTFVRAFAGGCIIVILTLLSGSTMYNGAGMDVVEAALNGHARPEAFALKILFTAVTVAAGFKGGEIVPAFFTGSTFGCTVAGLLGMDASLGGAIGFVALFCGIVNCPIASIMLAMEVFGGESVCVFAVVCAVSYVMSGNFGLYKSQKIVYSKLDERYIDANAS